MLCCLGPGSMWLFPKLKVVPLTACNCFSTTGWFTRTSVKWNYWTILGNKSLLLSVLIQFSSSLLRIWIIKVILCYDLILVNANRTFSFPQCAIKWFERNLRSRGLSFKGNNFLRSNFEQVFLRILFNRTTLRPPLVWPRQGRSWLGRERPWCQLHVWGWCRQQIPESTRSWSHLPSTSGIH